MLSRCVWVLGGCLFATASASAQDRMALLRPLVGEWETADTYETTSGPFMERGIRRCHEALKGSYIECVSATTRRDGVPREYRWLFSWDTTKQAYTLVQFWSDVSGHSVTTMTPDTTGRVWDLRSATPAAAGRPERRSWGTLEFVGATEIVWVGRANSADEPPDRWSHVFREVATRRNGGW